LLNDVLQTTMSMSRKLKEKMKNLFMWDVFVGDDFGLDIELGVLAKNMENEVIGVIDYFFSFLTKEERKKSMMKKKNSQYVSRNVRF